MNVRTTKRLRNVLSLDDFEIAARKHLPRPIFGYVAGAAETNRSLDDNRARIRRVCFVPRVLVDVSQRSQKTTLFGHTYAAPFGIAPMGIGALYAYRGDLVLARSGSQSEHPDDHERLIADPPGGCRGAKQGGWFQAYCRATAEITALIERIARAGFETLVMTVDTQVAGNRENNVRAGFSTPLRPTVRLAWDGLRHPRWLFGTFLRTLMRHGMPHFENNYATRGAPIMSSSVLRDYSDRGHLTGRTSPDPPAVEGPADGQGHPRRRRCAHRPRAGAEGIIVSNHGGRQLDGAVSPLRVLPGIVDACPNAGDDGQRDSSRNRRVEGAGARREVRIRRTAVPLCRGDGRRRGRRGKRSTCCDEVSRDMAMLGINDLQELDARRLLRIKGQPFAQASRTL